MRPTYAVIAALMPAVVLAAPAGKLPAQAAGFSRGAVLPKWAAPLADIPRTERTDPVVVRLNETQAIVGPAPATLYNRALQVNDSSELGAIGQFELSYFAQYQKLTLHRVMILRGDQRLDRTASVNIRPLQRETNIESGMLGGATNLQLLLDDVRIGDTLWITYTVEGENPVFGKRWSADFGWDAGSPVELRRVTVTHPRNRPLAWRQLGDFLTAPITPQTEQIGDQTRLRFEGRALEPVEGEPSVPSDYLAARLLQLTEYQDWNGVAQWADGLFPKLDASPELKKLARQFAGEATPEGRASAALHWVQEEIRYFSVSIGENSHRPQPPDVVLKRRYGDCKDKSYLLVSLLRELGVTAQLVLLSADAPKVAAKLLPTPGWFNHVIVRISIDGKDYYVDPTRTNQPEPLAAMPIAFPGAQVLLVDAASQGLSAIPERADTLPTFEHNEDITIADFSGPATLVTRDVYRSTYADGARAYYPRLSANEQKKMVLSKYEKLYPGISLEGVPEYKDVVDENRIEIVSRYKLPKGVTLKDKRYQVAFSSQVIEGSLGIPAKLVRNFPFELAGGRYSGRYRLRIHWPDQVRRVDPPHAKMLDNPYFQAREEFTLRGNEMDYLMDFRLKQRTLPAGELPSLEEQSKLLNEFIEGSMRIEESSISAPEVRAYTLRDLESIRNGNYVLTQIDLLKGKKDADITLEQACDYLDTNTELHEYTGADATVLGQRLDKLVQAAKPQPGLSACRAELALARGQSQQAIDALAADPLTDEASPLLRELAWAQFYTGDRAAALATMARYRAAREKAAGGTTEASDAASQIALLQRSDQPLPPALDQFARELPDGPWPRPLLAMQVGLLTPEQVLEIVNAMRGDSAVLARIDAQFYIGQSRLVAGDAAAALQAFRWLEGNGLRNRLLTRQARREIQLEFKRDVQADAGLQAMLKKDQAAAIAAWQKGASAGSSACQYALGLAAFNGEGLPKSAEQARRWFKLSADQGDVDGQAMLAVMYLYGEGGPVQLEQGLDLLRQSAVQGHAGSQAELGRRYRWGDGLKQDNAQAYEWLLQAANRGRPEAMAQLGGMFSNGEGMPKNAQQANFWNVRGAVYNNPNAVYNLALAAEHGDGVTQDYVRAAQLYRSAAERQHASAAGNLGFLYENGWGVKQDLAEAVRWYRQSAELGNANSMRNLGNMHANGRGVPHDLAKAEQYLKQAAQAGNVDALTNLGYMFEHQHRDYAQARMWYEKAAAKRQSDAEFNLALMYEEGRGVPADQKTALEWYRRAAEDGDRDAQYTLGQALIAGDVLPADQPRAIEWLGQSAAQGLAKAQFRLGEIYLRGSVGVQADGAKAVALLRQAAAQKYVAAYISLGRAYEGHAGIDADVQQAIAWYAKAPDQMEAQVRLGTLYLGAGKEPERGRALLLLADKQAVTLSDYASLARCYQAVDNNAKAEWAFTQGLKKAAGSDESYEYAYLGLMATFYRETYQFAKTLPLLQRQLGLAEKQGDAKAPLLMVTLEELGDMYQTLGRFADAETAYQRALTLKQAVYGEHSVEAAEMLNSIGGLLVAADKLDQGEDYVRRALAVDEAKGSSKLRGRVLHLARVLLAKGEYAEAEQQLRRAIALLEQPDAKPDEGRLADALNTLGVLYTRQHSYDKAGAALERALALLSKPGRENSYTIAVYQTNLARLRVEQQRYAEAAKLLQQSQATKARALGEDHAELSFGLLVEGILYERQRQYAKAVAPLQRALALRQADAGYAGTAVAEVLQELGEVYRLQGQDAQAAALLQQALDIRARVFGEQHPELKATRRSLAELQRKNGQA